MRSRLSGFRSGNENWRFESKHEFTLLGRAKTNIVWNRSARLPKNDRSQQES